jgi:hypothetical protein
MEYFALENKLQVAERSFDHETVKRLGTGGASCRRSPQ